MKIKRTIENVRSSLDVFLMAPEDQVKRPIIKKVAQLVAKETFTSDDLLPIINEAVKEKMVSKFALAALNTSYTYLLVMEGKVKEEMIQREYDFMVKHYGDKDDKI